MAVRFFKTSTIANDLKRFSGFYDGTSVFELDYLIIAGGGAGYGFNLGSQTGGGGGGGGGGFRSSFSTQGGSQPAAAKAGFLLGVNYTVTVGAGGAAGATGVQNPAGADSVFSTITSSGGGGTTGASFGLGQTGGSAGGSYYAVETNTQPVQNPIQGTQGGKSGPIGSNNFGSGGGGGGAGTGGGNGTGSGAGGTAGTGLASSISGTSVTYAAGGAGGANTTDANGVAGSVNTGNGGSGGATLNGGSQVGGSGGSGIVVLRYPNSFTITIGAGLTGTTATTGSDKVTTITAGTGNVSFA